MQLTLIYIELLHQAYNPLRHFASPVVIKNFVSNSGARKKIACSFTTFRPKP